MLHKFLEVFSCFDWDRYCLSLRGPIALDSFPNPVGARLSGRACPPVHWRVCAQQDVISLTWRSQYRQRKRLPALQHLKHLGELLSTVTVEPRAAEPGAPPPLLSDDFLVAVLAAYAPPASNPPRAFAVKQLNVSDPLVRLPRPSASQLCRGLCSASPGCLRLSGPLLAPRLGYHGDTDSMSLVHEGMAWHAGRRRRTTWAAASARPARRASARRSRTAPPRCTLQPCRRA